MIKIVVVITDVIEKNRIKSYLNRAKRKITEFEFELVQEFDDKREAVNFLYQNSEIDIVIVENLSKKVFSGLDLVMLAEKEFPQTSIILLNEVEKELELESSYINNLTAILNKNDGYKSFSNLLLLSILKQKRKKKKYKEKEQKLNDYRTIIDHTHDAIFLLEVDCDHNFYYKRINGTHQRLTALNNEEIKGKKVEEIFSKEVAAELKQNYRKCLKKKERINYTEKLTFPAGEKVWQTSLYPVVRNGRVEEIVGASYDITEMEAQQQKLDYIKRHDQLTGLYNKKYFNQLFSELNMQEENKLDLLLLNIENFHLINQFFGYQEGNQILTKIGSILAQIASENIIAAHLEADHFAVILKNQKSTDLKEISTFIKDKTAEINIDGVYIDTAVVSMAKLNNKKTAHDFFNDGVAKLNFNKYKKSSESRFYRSLMGKIEKNSYKNIPPKKDLINISKKTAAYFDLNSKEKEKILLLAKHHDLGKLAIDKNIVKKGDSLTDIEWQEYKKHLIISANFAVYYTDLAKIQNLVYNQYEHFDGSGWPRGIKGREIPYLSRLFAVINFYSKLKSNIYFPLYKDDYYFGALNKKEIIKKLKDYQGELFDPQIVDKFLSFLKTEN